MKIEHIIFNLVHINLIEEKYKMEFGRIVNTDDILKIKNKEKVLSDKIKKFKKTL